MILGDAKAGSSRPFEPEPFGRYLLVHRLAVGGMGEVFLARAPGPAGERWVVIKRLRDALATDPEFVGRFLDEGRIHASLQHGAIAQVLEVGDVNGAFYIALEFVDGKTLRELITRAGERNQRVPAALALHVTVQVLDALAYAHRKRDPTGRELGLIHRDISPPNVLLGYDGAVKVIDFGLAKSVVAMQRTNPSVVLGKFLYMSPEAARHQPLDSRADLFATGVVLHEMLVGRHILEDIPPAEILGRAGHPEFPRLAGQVPGVTRAIDDFIQRAVQAEPDRRFQSAEEMRAAAASLLSSIAPGYGPKDVSAQLHALFATEFAEERGVLAGYRKLGWPSAASAGDDEFPTLDSGALGDLATRPSADAFHEAMGSPLDGPTFPPSIGPPRKSDPTFQLGLRPLPESSDTVISRSALKAPLPEAEEWLPPDLVEPPGHDPSFSGETTFPPDTPEPPREPRHSVKVDVPEVTIEAAPRPVAPRTVSSPERPVRSRATPVRMRGVGSAAPSGPHPRLPESVRRPVAVPDNDKTSMSTSAHIDDDESTAAASASSAKGASGVPMTIVAVVAVALVVALGLVLLLHH